MLPVARATPTAWRLHFRRRNDNELLATSHAQDGTVVLLLALWSASAATPPRWHLVMRWRERWRRQRVSLVKQALMWVTATT